MALKFRQARAKAGLPKKPVLYCGRHDFGTRLLKKTGNLKLVMQTMGQVDVKTATKYQHPESDSSQPVDPSAHPQRQSSGSVQ
jgi:site-specific recombinase XerD